MKRLFKMLSLLSILLILGSCDSSKSVNVTNLSIEDIIVTFGVQDVYEDNNGDKYAISGFIKVENTATHEWKQYKKTEEIKGFMKAMETYDITWNMINTTTFELKSGLKYEGYKFAPESRNIKLKFGITDYAIEEE